MQLIARELNNSETAFIFLPDSNDCDGVIRYFTPTTEVPICGHATIAALFARTPRKSVERRSGVAAVIPVAVDDVSGSEDQLQRKLNISWSPTAEKRIADADVRCNGDR